jgi:carboxypeptidase C (cathepsin A)
MLQARNAKYARMPRRPSITGLSAAVLILFSAILFLPALVEPSAAQQRATEATPGAVVADDGGRQRWSVAPPTPLPAISVTHHTLTLPGRTLQVIATAGSLRTQDASGALQIDVAYIAYTLDGADPHARPVTFVFNGGPGASTAWLQLGAIGPWRLPFEGAALAPSAPPLVSPNAETWLDFTDLVFIDPPGSGFSRFATASADARNSVWTVDGDVELLASIVRRLVVQMDRTVATKFIVAESYGGIRGPRLVRALQTEQGIGIDGLTLVSPLLERGGRTTVSDPLTWVAHLPSMAAAAREEKGAVDRTNLADAEAYASGPYLVDLLRGEQDKDALARITEHVSALTGLEPSIVREHGGRIDNVTFLRQRPHRKGELGSIYDATMLSPDPFPEARRNSDAILDGLRAPLTGAMLDLYVHALKWMPDQPYEVLNATVARNWGWGRGGVESVSALREALALDSRFRVLIGHGMTDLATPYFATQLILNQLPPGIGGGRAKLEVYPGGHMFYARDGSRQAFREAAKTLYRTE